MSKPGHWEERPIGPLLDSYLYLVLVPDKPSADPKTCPHCGCCCEDRGEP